MGIAETLAGRRIGVTGATGFLGTAVVERLLRRVPECEVVVLVRPGRRATAADRLQREVLRNDAFDRLRAELGDRFDGEIGRRLHVMAGDVSRDGLDLTDAGRELLAGCDTVIHSAASVSFDSPLDAGVEVNLLGPVRVAQTMGEVRLDQGSGAHMVAVSTAYVAGNRRGNAAEVLPGDQGVHSEVNWRAEVDGARRMRNDADAESRRPEKLARFKKEARAELGAAGRPILSAKTERLRKQWVDDRMVEMGKVRAQALGWPDVYAYTKSLGERALSESHGKVPVTIVRPSIIESALVEPSPGWIRGFRMAEPVIISYARGLLKDFPGLPEGIVDVIPVDFVVAALLAVAAQGPDPEGLGVYQVVTGARNPLKYRQLVDLVQDWFGRHPIYDRDGQPIVVPSWSFPGRGRVQGQLRRSLNLLDRAEKVAGSLPIRGKTAEFVGRLEERRSDAERALGYVELYGAYVETEARFLDDRLAALWQGIEPGDRESFCFDTTTIDWERYVNEVHLPSIVTHARVRTKPGAKVSVAREERQRRAILSPERQMAVFDLENTLIASNVVDSYAWLATRRMGTADRVRFVAKLLREAPGLLALDREDRSDFLRHFYRRYNDAPLDQMRVDSTALVSELLLKKSFPAGFYRVREHRRLGHHTVLLTGALDFVVEPLRPLFDDVICASLDVRGDGRLTGEMLSAPPTGEARAFTLEDYARSRGIDMAESIAYADSASDLPMLEAVGFPVAVNPEAKLSAIARRRGWHVEQWAKSPGGPRPLLPIGARIGSRAR